MKNKMIQITTTESKAHEVAMKLFADAWIEGMKQSPNYLIGIEGDASAAVDAFYRKFTCHVQLDRQEASLGRDDGDAGDEVGA